MGLVVELVLVSGAVRWEREGAWEDYTGCHFGVWEWKKEEVRESGGRLLLTSSWYDYGMCTLYLQLTKQHGKTRESGGSLCFGWVLDLLLSSLLLVEEESGFLFFILLSLFLWKLYKSLYQVLKVESKFKFFFFFFIKVINLWNYFNI